MPLPPARTTAGSLVLALALVRGLLALALAWVLEMVLAWVAVVLARVSALVWAAMVLASALGLEAQLGNPWSTPRNHSGFLEHCTHQNWSTSHSLPCARQRGRSPLRGRPPCTETLKRSDPDLPTLKEVFPHTWCSRECQQGSFDTARALVQVLAMELQAAVLASTLGTQSNCTCSAATSIPCTRARPCHDTQADSGRAQARNH